MEKLSSFSGSAQAYAEYVRTIRRTYEENKNGHWISGAPFFILADIERCLLLLAEGGRIIRAERREDLRARAGLTEESLSALEAVCGKTAGDAGYEEAVGLAAVLFAAGFTAEEAQRFSPASGGGSFSKSGAGRS